MDGSVFGGQQTPPVTYDYRLYDRIWQRVSPELVPYPQVRASAADSPQTAAAGLVSTAQQTETAPEGGEATLPGAAPDPCCLGTAAMDSVAVLEGFAAEELAERRCYLALAGSVCRQDVKNLLRCMAGEKLAAARELRAAIYLITGACFEPEISVEPMRWRCLADALRSCYHQEACDGFNYRRSADGTTDPCLQKLLTRLSDQAYQRAQCVMSLLGQIIGKNG